MVGRRYWFESETADAIAREEGTERSWAEAVNRISVTGETLVVDISDVDDLEDRRARRNQIKTLRSVMRVVSRRRAIRVTSHISGPYLRFRVL